MSVFDRGYLLTITNPPKFKPDPEKPYLEQLSEYVVGTPRTVDSFNISELRVSARVQSTISNSTSPYTEIKIFNATPRIKEKLRKPNAYITLAAGYKRFLGGLGVVVSTNTNDLPLIFSGEVVDSITRKDGQDFITTIRAKGEEIARRDSYISAFYSGGQTIESIVTDIVERFLPRINVGRLELAPIFIPKQRLNNGYSAFGKVSDVLDELAADFGFVWYTVGNKFYAQPPNYGRARSFVNITPANIIGDLMPTAGTNNTSNPEGSKSGIKFKVFLDGRLDPSKLVRVSRFDEGRNGNYKIIDLSHVLDTRGQEWYTEITAEGV